MALIHNQSKESIHEGLDLFFIPPTQTAVQDGAFVEYHPLATLAPDAPIEFSISGSTTDYLDLSNTFLQLDTKLLNPDGSDIAAGADVAPCNNFLHSLISQVDISLNDTVITSSENTYAYRAYLETLLDYGRECKESQLTAQLYHKDTAGHVNDTRGANNLGLVARRAEAAQSRVIEMMGRLHTDITHQTRYILPGVRVKIRLIPTRRTFHLMKDAAVAEDVRAIITRASLFVRKLKLNPAVGLAHEKTLLKATAKYPIKRVVIKTFSIPTGNFGIIQDNLFLSQTPTRLVMGVVRTSAFNGSYTENPFNFQNYDINFVSLYLDGKAVPAKPLTPNFAGRAYVRSYHSLMSSLGLNHKNEACDISYTDYASGYTLFGFDLSPSMLDGNQFELLKSGALRLEIKFGTPLPHPATVIVYGELDAMIQIDRSRQVLTDFTV